MIYRTLGRTNLKVSEIGIGCSGYWGNKAFPEEQAIRIILKAFELGVNFFDTGHNYCNFNAEPRLGIAIKEILKNNDRSRIVISTKGGSIIGSALNIPFSNGRTQDFSPESIELSCMESIKNLNCSYLDIFQLHGFSESLMDSNLIDRLATLKRKGVIRSIGVNTHTEKEMRFVAKHNDIFDMVLIDYNILQLDRDMIIEELFDSGIAVVAGTVLAQGHLVNSMSGSFWDGSFFWYLARALLKSSSRALAVGSRRMRRVLKQISEMSPSQAAFSYALQNPKISSCVFGTTKIDNLVEIIGASGKLLSDKSRVAIRAAFESMPRKISE